MLISYPDALALTLAQEFNWGQESLPFNPPGILRPVALMNRVLARSVVTDRPQPPFDRVTMDGIALNHRSYAKGQREFPVAGIVAAGSEPITLTDPKTCLEVMTGAVRPPGTTTIVRYEDLERTATGFRLPDGVEDAKNIHREGSDAPQGHTLLAPGSVIGGAAVNLLASCGYASVSVRKLPRTAVIATGDELVGVGETPRPHQIRMSNLFHLQSELSTAGVTPTIHHIKDNPKQLRQRIASLLSENDLLIFSGGVSKGRYDFLPEILEDLGVEKLFHRVAQRPGKPLWVGRTAETMIFGLPGNPVSSLTGLLAYVGPWLRKNLGVAENDQARTLDAEVRFKKELSLFQLVAVDHQSQKVRAVSNAGSGDAASLLRGDGLLVLPAERDVFAAGEAFPYIPFGSLLG